MISEGSRVRIQALGHRDHGNLGTVVRPYKIWKGFWTVRIDGRPEGDNHGFAESELKEIGQEE